MWLSTREVILPLSWVKLAKLPPFPLFVCACTCVGMLVEARGLNVERLSHDLYDYNVVISTLFFDTVSH